MVAKGEQVYPEWLKAAAERVRHLRVGRHLVYHEVTGSTNDDARRLAEAGAPDGLVVLADEQTQLYRIGAQGLLPSTNTALSCLSINAEKQIWTNAAPRACNQIVVSQVTSFLCGLATRFSAETPGACAGVPEVESLAGVYAPDTDLTDVEDYASYAGNARRAITVAVVDQIQNTSSMIVLGFRQFLVEPNPDDVTINPADRYGRFAALYIGYPVPVRQGRFDGCMVTAGPGKVVLHQ